MLDMRKFSFNYRLMICVYTSLSVILVIAITVLKPDISVQKKQIIECAAEKSEDFNCWSQRFEAIVDNETPLSALQSAQSEYNKQGYVRRNCHQFAHIIGREAAKKYSLDISKTFENGNQFCASGYYHGAVEAIVSASGPINIKSKINDVCKSLRQQGAYKLKHYDCEHGLGHGVMEMEDYELFKALGDCELLKDTWESESCASGVFMENIGSIFASPTTSKYLKSDDLLYPCDAVADVHKYSCYINQTSYVLRQINYDYSKMFQICAQANNFAYACYQSLGRDASGNTIQDPAKANAICQLGTRYEQKQNCIASAVKDIIWISNSRSKGQVLCDLQTDNQLKQACITTADEYIKTFN